MRIVWFFTALMACVAQAASGAPPPIEAFGRIPAVARVALSPDGKTVAWDDSSGKQPVVVVFDLEARKHKSSFPVAAGTKLRGLDWADDTTLLIDLSMFQTVRLNRKIKNEWFRTLAVDVTTGDSRMLLIDDQELSGGAEMLAARTAKPHSVTMAKWSYDATSARSPAGTRIAGRRQDSGWVYSVYSVDTRSGGGTLLETGTQFTDEWVVDAAGLPVARSEWEPSKPKYTILAKDGRVWRPIYTQNDGERLLLAGLSADGRAVLGTGANGQATSRLWSIPLDGSGAKVLVEDPARDVMYRVFDPLTAALVGVQFGGASLDIHWLDQKAQARYKSLHQAFPGRQVHIDGRSRDYQRVVALVEGTSVPTMFYFVDFAAGRADILGESYPGLADVKLGEMRSISYKARDGASIPAYLTLPPGSGEKNLPLVVLPHGGPHSRDYFEFDWWVQFLASRGYAVLQPQFRGSTGFGEAHRTAGYRQWGGLMQDDVTDAAKALIDQGLADPRRVCIVGASYGGYAALAGAAFTPDLYACAASVNGVSDLPTLLNYLEREGGEESDALFFGRERIGSESDPKIAEKSPARAAASIKAPVLLVHGIDDIVVPVLHSQRMHDALASLGKPVRFVKLPGEDHWLSSSETRIRMLAELESFLAQHLGAAAAAAVSSAASSGSEAGR